MTDLTAVVYDAAEIATATGDLDGDDPAGTVENGALAVARHVPYSNDVNRVGAVLKRGTLVKRPTSGAATSGRDASGGAGSDGTGSSAGGGADE